MKKNNSWVDWSADWDDQNDKNAQGNGDDDDVMSVTYSLNDDLSVSSAEDEEANKNLNSEDSDKIEPVVVKGEEDPEEVDDERLKRPEYQLYRMVPPGL